MGYKKKLITYNSSFPVRVFKFTEESDKIPSYLHWHKDYEIIYVKKGPVKLLRPGEETVLNDGDVCVLNSEEVHSYPESNTGKCYLLASVPPFAIKPYLNDNKTEPKFKIKNDSIKLALSRSMKLLYDIENFNDKTDILKFKALLDNVFYYLLKYCIDDSVQYISGSDAGSLDCAATAMDYIEKNYCRNLSLTEISNYVGMTPAHFSKYFKKNTGMTFSSYLRKTRLERAVRDMTLTGCTVKEAALRNGFPNVNSFIESCKKEYGQTPLEIKKNFFI